MKTVVISIRVSEDLAERLKKATDNRNVFIVEAIEEKLSPPAPPVELTDTEKRNALKGAKNISDVLQDLILQEAARRKNFLGKMGDDDFARLVVSRLPKEAAADAELEESVLSLKQCLAGLPEVPDITAELTKVKGQLYKTELERDFNLKLLAHSQGNAELGELMKLVYEGAVSYVVDLVARKNLPGFGDGGGITDAAYAKIAEEVRGELEKLKVFRGK